MKKDKSNNKKKERKQKQHQNVLSLGFDEAKGKTQTWFFEMKEREMPPKQDQEQVKDFEASGQGKATARKLAQIASRCLKFLFAISTFDTLPIPKAEAPQAFRAAFPHKTGNGLKVKRLKMAK